MILSLHAFALLFERRFPMKIAQIAPLAESCPPRLYGGTERIVSYLTEELVQQGHEVTLFASGDSKTRAELVSCADIGLRMNPHVYDPLPHNVLMLERVRQRAHEFDVIHFHIDLLQFPIIHPFADKTVTTLHGRLDLHGLLPFYTAFPNIPLASISFNQRTPLPTRVNWAGNVYHGLPCDHLRYSPEPQGGYLAFLGRISPEKRPDRAIEIAVRAGLPLRIAAKIDKADQEWWDEVVEPMVKANPLVEYVGEIDERRKADFLGGAIALLFPIDWPEPFGLVMIESLACGTPVIAFRSGSVPEVIDDGVTGFVVGSIEEAVEAVGRIPEIDRATVRAAFDNRFTVERMARDYLKIYADLPGFRREGMLPRAVNGHAHGIGLAG
jgi:glycosyltransferase involved in cell wall biosynthesis